MIAGTESTIRKIATPASRASTVTAAIVAPLEKIRVFDARVERPPHYDTFAEFQYAYHYGDMYAPYIKQEEPLKTECQHFLECIRDGKQPLSGGKQGLELVRILEAASVSLRQNGSPVHFVQPESALIAHSISAQKSNRQPVIPKLPVLRNRRPDSKACISGCTRFSCAAKQQSPSLAHIFLQPSVQRCQVELVHAACAR